LKLINSLVIIPPYEKVANNYYVALPLGLTYIIAYLKKHGFQVYCLNLNVVQGSLEEAIRQTIEENQIDVVLIGGLAPNFPSIKSALLSTKKVSPSVTTVLGGGLVTSEPELVLRNLPVDIGVIGEGEETVVELLSLLSQSDKKNFRQVKGIAYIDENDQFIQTEMRPVISNLDTIPYPDLEALNIRSFIEVEQKHWNLNPISSLYVVDHPRAIAIMGSRSCPYKCTFCYHPGGANYRQRSLFSLIEEIRYVIKEYKANVICIYDECFALDHDRIKAFCLEIKPLGVNWYVQLRVDCVDEDILRIMKDAGCHYVSYGLESMDSTVLQSMKKRVTSEQIEKALYLTRQVGINIQGNFIFGDIAETTATAQKTLDWWKQNRMLGINLTMLLSYPNSEDYQFAVQRGIIKDKIKFLEEGCPVVNISQMDEAEYQALTTTISRINREERLFTPRIFEAKVKNVDEDGISLDLKCICPQCHSEGHFLDFLVPFAPYVVFKVGCRHCHCRFDISTDQIEALNLYIQDAFTDLSNCFPDHMMGIWGGGMVTQKALIPALGIKGTLIKFVLDNDSTKWGQNLKGIPICSPRDNIGNCKKLIIISVFGAEEKIIGQIKEIGREDFDQYITLRDILIEHRKVLKD
jgi:anaerobic magnesium-protoporphyrin IX monomethyl ester cyclase